MEGVKCDYCHRDAKLVSGKAIYPHRPELFAKWFYECKPCSAYVGCHPGTKQALGRLANAELRRLKQAAHAAFDPLWRSKQMKRSQAYKWLGEQIGVAPQNCHIGMFNEDACRAVVNVCKTVATRGAGA